jgi:acyl carrier protein
MTEAEIREKFAEVVAQSLKIDVEQVSPEAYLDDLGAESLDLIEIAMEVESNFRVWLPEKSILQTAIDVYGPGVLEKDGYLTEEGKALFQQRLPAEDAARFGGTVSLKDVNRYFMQVETWVHMIDGLLVYTPTACAACGGPLEASLGFRLKCTACGLEVPLKSGDDINREWVQQFAARSRDQHPAAVQA